MQGKREDCVPLNVGLVKREAVGVFNIGGGSRALPPSFRLFFVDKRNAWAGYGVLFPFKQKATQMQFALAFHGKASSFLGYEH